MASLLLISILFVVVVIPRTLRESVIIFSVEAEPADEVTVTMPVEATTFKPESKLIIVTAAPTLEPLSSILIPLPTAVKLSKLEPSIAGRDPVNSPAGRLVKFAPDPVIVPSTERLPVIVAPPPTVNFSVGNVELIPRLPDWVRTIALLEAFVNQLNAVPNPLGFK